MTNLVIPIGIQLDFKAIDYSQEVPVNGTVDFVYVPSEGYDIGFGASEINPGYAVINSGYTVDPGIVITQISVETSDGYNVFTMTAKDIDGSGGYARAHVLIVKLGI